MCLLRLRWRPAGWPVLSPFEELDVPRGIPFDPSSSFLTNAVLRLYHLGGREAHHHYIAARERSAALFAQRKYEAVLEKPRHDSGDRRGSTAKPA